MKIALIPGHTKTSSGAVNYKGESEYPWALRVLTKAIAYMPKIECVIITRDNIGIEGAVKKAKELGCIAVYEQHFNWCESDPKEDIEILADKRLPKSIKWAKFIAKKQNETYKSFGLRRDMGCFATTPSDRGGNNVAQAVTHGIEYSVLGEAQFGNLRNSDAEQIFEHDDMFAKFIGDTMTEFFTAEGLLGDAPTEKPWEMPPVADPKKWNPEGFITKLKKLLDDPTDERIADMRDTVLPSAEAKIRALLTAK